MYDNKPKFMTTDVWETLVQGVEETTTEMDIEDAIEHVIEFSGYGSHRLDFKVRDALHEEFESGNDLGNCLCGEPAVTEIVDPRCPADVVRELGRVPMMPVCEEHVQ